ncbi:MAG: hypothetical protein ACJ8LI_11300 [Chthoniobacterales bacterium]
MRIAVFLFALVLSLPNLIAGLALAVLRHTFTTRNPLLLMLNFFEGVVWGVPVTAAIMIILSMAGCFAETRRYAAVIAFLLNIAALVIVLTIMGRPDDAGQLIVFVPLALALIGFGWIAGTANAELRMTN